MRGDKKGQFFLLAAVIISVIVLSLGATTNKIIVQNNFQDISDFTYEVEREIGEVLNYEIYTEIDGKVEDFARLMAEDIQDKDPDTEFIFIFGNDKGMKVTNYGKEEIGVVVGIVKNMVFCRYDVDGFRIGDGDVPRESCDTLDCHACESLCPSRPELDVCVDFNSVDAAYKDRECMLNGMLVECSTINFPNGDITSEISGDDLAGKGEITVTIDGIDVVIPVSEHEQVHLIIKKDLDDETFIESR